MNGYFVREVVVVTGASAGVGRATVRAFAKRGARLGLIARGKDGLDATVREVEELGGEALAFPLDVADASQVEAAAVAVEKAFGPLDIWVNDAMTSVFSPFKEMTAEEFRRVTEVNYLGYVNGTMAALKRMLPRDHGSIVQVGSALGFRSIPLQSAYCGSKAAIRGFTDSVRCELLHDKSKVHITMVQMPALNTPQFGWVKSRLPRKAQPVPPIFQPELAADAIVWAAHQRKRQVYVGGSTVQAIWGNRVMSALLDRYFAKKGYQAQMTDQPEDPNRPHDLWSPLPGDRGAHGSFDSRAHARSLQWKVNQHKGWFGLGALAVGAAGAAGLALRRR